MKPPPPSWIGANALTAAPRILGWELVSLTDGQETAGRIVEVEVYHGAEDPASHAYRGLTPRTAPMFEAGGAVYVYLSYGIHTCLNLVTGPAGQAEALLIRALEPTTGLETMMRRRRTTKLTALTNGPGKVGQALGISLALSGTTLDGALQLRPPLTGRAVNPNDIATSPRIGIRQAADRPWRFYIRDNEYVSGPKNQ